MHAVGSDIFCSHSDLIDMFMDQTRTYVTQMTRAMDKLLPLDVDDDLISEHQILKQPEDRCSLTAGLNGMTAINIHLMEAHPAKAAISSHWPQVVNMQEGQEISCTCADDSRQPDVVCVASEQLSRLEHCLDNVNETLLPSLQTSWVRSSSPSSELLNSQLDTVRVNLHATHLWAQNILVERLRTTAESNLKSEALSLLDAFCWRTQERIGRQLLDLLRTVPRANLLHNGLVLVSLVKRFGSLVQEPGHLTKSVVR